MVEDGKCQKGNGAQAGKFDAGSMELLSKLVDQSLE